MVVQDYIQIVQLFLLYRILLILDEEKSAGAPKWADSIIAGVLTVVIYVTFSIIAIVQGNT